MDEYIEKDAAIAALTEFCYEQTVSKYLSVDDCLVARGAIERASKVLESLPATDVEPVVRCRECKHWLKDVTVCSGFVGRCDFAKYMVGAEGYCSYGERKDGDGNG